MATPSWPMITLFLLSVAGVTSLPDAWPVQHSHIEHEHTPDKLTIVNKVSFRRCCCPAHGLYFVMCAGLT